MTKKNDLKISLIIPAYNEEDSIVGCLEKAIEHSGGKFHEIIVINNSSTDKTRELALTVPGVKVVDELNKGLTKARQKGLEVATGDYLAYIDADTRLHPLWYNIADKFFNKHPDAVSLSGPYRYYDGSIIKNFFQHIIWWVNAPISYYMAGYMILGGNFIAKKDALEKMGGFDKNIEFYGEDTNISRRLSEFGDVVFKMDFFIYSSSRRFQKEGVIKTNLVYALNFIWQVLFKKPFSNSKTYLDHRIKNTKESNDINRYVKKQAGRKAWIISGFFALAFIITWTVESFDWHLAIPLAIFYAVFVFNTFFSIKCFSSITPPYSFIHGILDLVLVSLYIGMAINVRAVPYFIFFCLLIFAVSSIKYTLLLGSIEYDHIIKRKILIDILGVCGTSLVIGGIFAGYPRFSLWAWVLIFILANVILFIFWPFYRLDDNERID
jgi:glycosyltransferase involved in cell wall biosynthesis